MDGVPDRQFLDEAIDWLIEEYRGRIRELAGSGAQAQIVAEFERHAEELEGGHLWLDSIYSRIERSGGGLSQVLERRRNFENAVRPQGQPPYNVGQHRIYIKPDLSPFGPIPRFREMLQLREREERAELALQKHNLETFIRFLDRKYAVLDPDYVIPPYSLNRP